MGGICEFPGENVIFAPLLPHRCLPIALPVPPPLPHRRKHRCPPTSPPHGAQGNGDGFLLNEPVIAERVSEEKGGALGKAPPFFCERWPASASARRTIVGNRLAIAGGHSDAAAGGGLGGRVVYIVGDVSIHAHARRCCGVAAH